MRRRWISLSPGASLYEAERLMRLARIRQVPVVHEGVLVGLVTYRDLLETTIERLGGGAPSVPARTVGEVASPPEVIGPDASLAEAVARMVRAGVGCLSVLEPAQVGSTLVGLLTEADLLRVAYDPLSAPEWA